VKLDHAENFSGILTGFDGNDVLDLGDIAAGTATLNFTANTQGTGGTLTVSDGNYFKNAGYAST
jgi:hypothetical protein